MFRDLSRLTSGSDRCIGGNFLRQRLSLLPGCPLFFEGLAELSYLTSLKVYEYMTGGKEGGIMTTYINKAQKRHVLVGGSLVSSVLRQVI